MTIKLKNRLVLIFITFSLIIISLVSIVSGIYIEKNFNIYAQKKIEENKKDVYERIVKEYKNGKWDTNNIKLIGYSAIEKGLIISVKGKADNIIWDAREYNNIECEIALAKMRYNTTKIEPESNINNTIENFKVDINGEFVGTVNIEYLGPLYYNDSDVILFEMLSKILVILSIVFFILSIIIGVMVSLSLSKPILKVIDATNLISEGNYGSKISEKSNIEEVNRLITSVNKMASNIEYQEDLRKIMTKDISHELRTPLTIMQAQLEAIIDGLCEPSQDRLKSIHEELQRLNRLIESSEELVKYDSGSINLNKIEVEISSLLDTTLINFEKHLLDKDIKLEMNTNKCKVLVDKDKIRQVIVNLFSNSIRYTDRGGKITVNCFNDKDMVCISIKDSGIGIDEKDIDYIFERFYRTDKSRNKCSGGLGIGLTISKSIVEAHGGYIKVNSIINKGTEFIVCLPKL